MVESLNDVAKPKRNPFVAICLALAERPQVNNSTAKQTPFSFIILLLSIVGILSSKIGF